MRAFTTTTPHPNRFASRHIFGQISVSITTNTAGRSLRNTRRTQKQ